MNYIFILLLLYPYNRCTQVVVPIYYYYYYYMATLFYGIIFIIVYTRIQCRFIVVRQKALLLYMDIICASRDFSGNRLVCRDRRRKLLTILYYYYQRVIDFFFYHICIIIYYYYESSLRPSRRFDISRRDRRRNAYDITIYIVLYTVHGVHIQCYTRGLVLNIITITSADDDGGIILLYTG